MSDTAGYSDLVFGLFRLLGYQFSPRVADLGDSRLWRIDAAGNYGPLNRIARNRSTSVSSLRSGKTFCGRSAPSCLGR